MRQSLLPYLKAHFRYYCSSSVSNVTSLSLCLPFVLPCQPTEDLAARKLLTLTLPCAVLKGWTWTTLLSQDLVFDTFSDPWFIYSEHMGKGVGLCLEALTKGGEQASHSQNNCSSEQIPSGEPLSIHVFTGAVWSAKNYLNQHRLLDVAWSARTRKWWKLHCQWNKISQFTVNVLAFKSGHIRVGKENKTSWQE